LNQPFHHDSFPMGPARSVSPRLRIPHAGVVRCQCSPDTSMRGAAEHKRASVPGVSRMVHYGSLTEARSLSDATPIARGTLPSVAIPVLTIVVADRPTLNGHWHLTRRLRPGAFFICLFQVVAGGVTAGIVGPGPGGPGRVLTSGPSPVTVGIEQRGPGLLFSRSA
jgi:hypothetical protein